MFPGDSRCLKETCGGLWFCRANPKCWRSCFSFDQPAVPMGRGASTGRRLLSKRGSRGEPLVFGCFASVTAPILAGLAGEVPHRGGVGPCWLRGSRAGSEPLWAGSRSRALPWSLDGPGQVWKSGGTSLPAPEDHLGWSDLSPLSRPLCSTSLPGWFRTLSSRPRLSVHWGPKLNALFQGWPDQR